ncbi:iron chelate uptake ABC transporter family permease subunit [Pontibacillus yanchengensis]|uniref:Iron chelate uptake ABC transporter family permease subunit n=2 Tax=Pontibacillus yanchengensis TaxID=462910 RepID=A0ACC7VKS2_9BACI|nr:metal ABC transporter permease [Pontibacillus yanchengensis]MYL33695.1 iron chelate uptake ABC transporter family permease subunit [Pontibacillus yanchengensis]MYL55407.1 iron chelate uptake ABC transporter family permease subunit [Pontibacillus yanchengensis]
MISSFLQYEFLQNAFFTALLIGFIAPLLGTFVVVRRLSLIADALSHVTLSGIAFGLMLDKKLGGFALTPFYTGMGFSVLGSIFIEQLRRVYKAYQELAIPIILSGGVGLSVIFISLADGFNTDLFNYLFGSVTAVSRQDLWTILVVAVVVTSLVFLFYKELFMLSFDEEHAVVSGIHAKRIHFLFIILTALVIAASIRIVGVLLVSALMTLPVAASIRLARGFKQTIAYSILFGEASVIIGLIAGYYFEIPPGGTIVVTAILILIITLGIKKLQQRSHFKKVMS